MQSMQEFLWDKRSERLALLGERKNHNKVDFGDEETVWSCLTYLPICDQLDILKRPYLIFVIFFTRAKFLENKIYTEKRQFFALNL